MRRAGDIDGDLDVALLASPCALSVDATTGSLYIIDTTGDKIRVMTTTHLTTMAIFGSTFHDLTNLTCPPQGEVAYVIDGHSIKQLTLSNGYSQRHVGYPIAGYCDASQLFNTPKSLAMNTNCSDPAFWVAVNASCYRMFSCSQG
jgi:hypothetical protein